MGLITMESKPSNRKLPITHYFRRVSFRLPRVCLIPMVSVLGLAQSVFAAVDVVGSEDVDGYQRYPNSYIVQYSQASVPEYRLALGRMKKIDGVIRPEKADYISGLLTQVTYRIPSGHSSREVFANIQRQLETIPHKIMYQCSGRGCGSSNQWANSQFGIAKLYGVDREQRYAVIQFNDQKGVVWVVYTVQRGNKRVYAHIEEIRPVTDSGQLSADDLLSQLGRGERVSIQDRDWSGEQLSMLSTVIGGLLQDRPLSNIWLVGHQASNAPFVTLLNNSRNRADGLRQQLIDLGIDGNRIKSSGVGALAPAHDDAVPENRIEVIVE